MSEYSKAQRHLEHQDTIFGQLWNVISPVFMAAVYYALVFVLQGGHKGPDYFVHLLAGVFFFNFISTAARRCAVSVTSSGRLIMNTAFPRAILPLTQVPLGTMVLNVTNQCNLACTYCYEYGEDKIVETENGILYGARREQGDGSIYWRTTQMVFPSYAFFPGQEDGTGNLHMYTPVDDEHTLHWGLNWHPTKALPGERKLTQYFEPMGGVNGTMFCSSGLLGP